MFQFVKSAWIGWVRVLYYESTTKEQRMPAKTTRARSKKLVVPAPVVQEGPQRPDVVLLTNEQLWSDLQNRVKVHNYEFALAVRDLKNTIEFTKAQFAKVSS